MSLGIYIAELLESGRVTFTSEEAVAALGASPVAVQAALRRSRKRGEIASPRRGFHVIVPPEYRRLGCRPAGHFMPELMEYLDRPYYVALLSAAALHGAAHQQPQIYQVMTDHVLPDVAVGKIRIEFSGRENIGQMAVVEQNTPTGRLRIATPETTAFDLVGYPSRAGSWNNIATVLTELSEEMDPTLLAKVAPHSPMAWSQRLGVLLDLVDAGDTSRDLAAYVQRASPKTVKLDPSRPGSGAQRSKRWRVSLNVEVEADL